MDKSLSESDLNNIVNESSPTQYTSNRSKRLKRRRGDDFATDLTDFRMEMKQMMMSLFAQHKEDIKDILPTLKEIQNVNTKIQASMEFLATQNSELFKKLNILENQVTDYQRNIKLLEEKLEDFQRLHRKCDFEIKNVPKNSKETSSDLLNMVSKLAESVKSDLKLSNIKDIYRIKGKKVNAQNSSIIVETNSSLAKTDLLKKCKDYNKKQTIKLCGKNLGLKYLAENPIYVSEHLTPRGSRLYFLARDLSQSRAYRFCWTAHGKVFVRKSETTPIICITNEAQVQQLMIDK